MINDDKPWIKPFPNFPPEGRKIVCPKCKLDMTGFMGYVCTRESCPVSTRVTC